MSWTACCSMQKQGERYNIYTIQETLTSKSEWRETRLCFEHFICVPRALLYCVNGCNGFNITIITVIQPTLTEAFSRCFQVLSCCVKLRTWNVVFVSYTYHIIWQTDLILRGVASIYVWTELKKGGGSGSNDRMACLRQEKAISKMEIRNWVREVKCSIKTGECDLVRR